MTETEAKWAERVREWKQSGKSLRAFGEGKPYRALTLGWWATELRRRGKLAPVGGGKKALVSTAVPAVAMAPVVRPCAKADGDASLILDVAGTSIRVRSGFDRGLLASVVAVLKEAR